MRRKLTISANLAAIVFAMTSVLVFAWVFDFMEELYLQILVTLVATLVLGSLFFGKVRKGFQFDNFKITGLWMSIPMALLVGALINFYLDRLILLMPTWVVLNIGFLLILIPIGFIYWYIAGKRRFLEAAATLNIGVAWLWLHLEILKSGAEAEFLLGLLAIAMYFGIPWIVILRLFWEGAKRTRCRPLAEPFMESLTMLLVAGPLVALVMLSTKVVTDDRNWIALSGIVVSFLFSSAVSTPFRQFLRALGGFDENRRGPIR